MKSVRTRLLATAAILALGGPAYAADMAVKAPPVPPVAPVTTWTGFYVGVSVGGAGWDPQCSASNNNSIAAVRNNGITACSVAGSNSLNNFVDLSHNGSAVGGPKIGYDWQWGNVVLGIVGDWSLIDLNTSLTVPPGPTIEPTSARANLQVNWLASARGRLGWAVNDWLLYATGGVAWARIGMNAGLQGSCCGDWQASGNTTKTGAVAGGGIEYRFSQHVSLVAEGLWYGGFGAASLSGTCACIIPTQTATYTTNFKIQDIFVGTVGLNLRF
jgi:outer membrane immunogenic protein